MNPFSLYNRYETLVSPQRPVAVTRFSGLTSKLAGRQWISEDTFLRAVQASSTAYIGQLPTQLVRLAPNSPKVVYQALNEISSVLRNLANIDLNMSEPELKLLSGQFHLTELGTPVAFRCVGRGGYGSAFRLTVNNQSFLLKVYHRKQNPMTGGYNELSAGLYFSKMKLRDLPHLYCGNSEAGWGLFEFITPEMTVDQRKGKSLAHYGVVFCDDGGANRINGILVDYGGFGKKIEEFPVKNFDTFSQALGSADSDVQCLACHKLYNVEPEKRLAAFKLAIQHADPKVQTAICNSLFSLPDVPRWEAFTLAMGTQIPEVQAAVVRCISALPLELREKAFTQAMATKASKVKAMAASAIHFLPLDKKIMAFQSLLNTGDPIVQESAAKNLRMLPEFYQGKAYAKLMAILNHKVQAQAASQVHTLPTQFRLPALQIALSSGIPEVEAAAAEQVYMFREKKEEAFKEVMASNSVAAHRSMMKLIHVLEQPLCVKAYDYAFTSKDTEAQRIAARQISHLPEYTREASFNKAIKTNSPEVQAAAASQIFSLPSDTLRAKAFESAIDSPDFQAKAAAASQIRTLPPSKQSAAFTQYVQALKWSQELQAIDQLNISFTE